MSIGSCSIGRLSQRSSRNECAGVAAVPNPVAHSLMFKIGWQSSRRVVFWAFSGLARGVCEVAAPQREITAFTPLATSSDRVSLCRFA